MTDENLALLMTQDESRLIFPWPRSEWKLPPARVIGGKWRPIRGHYLGVQQNTLVTLLWWQIEALVHWSSARLYCGWKRNNDLNMMETWQKLEQAKLTVHLLTKEVNIRDCQSNDQENIAWFTFTREIDLMMWSELETCHHKWYLDIENCFLLQSLNYSSW